LRPECRAASVVIKSYRASGVVLSQLSGLKKVVVTAYVSPKIPLVDAADTVAADISTSVGAQLRTASLVTSSRETTVFSIAVQPIDTPCSDLAVIRVELQEEVLLKRNSRAAQSVWATTWSQQVIEGLKVPDAKAYVRSRVDSLVAHISWRLTSR
jgi:hypothetical protein